MRKYICSALLLCLLLVSGCSLQVKKNSDPVLLDSVRQEPDIIVEKNITITKEQLQKKLSHAETARLIEVFRGVEYSERYPRYRIFDIKSGSTLALLGFKNGDILEAAHGYVVKDTAALSKYIEILPTQKEAFFDIIRVGTPMKLRIKID
jgi:type II secretory pathway component PulC